MALTQLYRHSLALLTDLYQITMAYGYWKRGAADDRAVFHLTFRQNPFHGGFTIACGLEYVVEFIRELRFTGDDVAYLQTLRGNDGRPLFEPAFLDYLRELRFGLDVDAIPEGTVVFPNEPLVRVAGPILQGQLIETPLLTIINFQSLIATKAARICQAAAGDPVIEFGLRRAQGIDGGITASRAAYVGGCVGTSNVLAGKLFDIPVKGTHAHSWVMSFEDERDAFRSYAEAQPNNTVLLVDTYNSIEGIRRAAEVGKQLAARGHRLIGIRLDSGDLAALSIAARKILDDAGLPDAGILASNDLDEHAIADLKSRGAKINVWGVGTRLATAYDQPALGGIYKLGAIRDRATGAWRHTVKLSDSTVKTSLPGVQQVRRFSDRDTGHFCGDAIWSEDIRPHDPPAAIDPYDPTRPLTIPGNSVAQDLLVPIFRAGQQVYSPPSTADARRRCQDQLASVPPDVRRLRNPAHYPVGLEQALADERTRLIERARATNR